MKLANKIPAILTVIIVMMLMLSFSSSAALKPSKPTGVKAVATASDRVSLTWKKTPGADYYKVYVKKDRKWKSLEKTKTSKYEISGLTAGKTYTFAVRSVNKSGGKNYLCDGYSTAKVKTKGLTAAKLSAVSGADYVTLSWKKVPGATGYYVCQKIDGEWLRVKKLDSGTLTCNIKKLKSKTSYQFFVRAIVSDGERTETGPKSNTVKLKTLKANKVKIKVASADETSVTLAWSKAADASGYCVYRFIDGKWKSVKTVNSRDTLKYTVTSLKSDSKYRFAVRAFKNSSSGKRWFVPSDEVIGTTDPTSKNLTLTRTKKLSKLLKGKSFALFYKTETQKYGSIPVKIYKSGGKYRLESRSNEISYVLINGSKADYVLLPDKKVYMKVPKALHGATDISDAVSALLPEKDWNGKAILAEFGGKKAVCEVYTDILKTKSVRYYYRAGELVGIEQYNSAGKIVERATVSQISNTADSSLFKIPDGYKEIL